MNIRTRLQMELILLEAKIGFNQAFLDKLSFDTLMGLCSDLGI